jgi:hypothetical protein
MTAEFWEGIHSLGEQSWVGWKLPRRGGKIPEGWKMLKDQRHRGESNGVGRAGAASFLFSAILGSPTARLSLFCLDHTTS